MTDNTTSVAVPVNHQAFNIHLGEMMPQEVVDKTIGLLDDAENVELGPLDVKFLLDEASDAGKFNWNDMPIVNSESGNNPHFFEYQNERGRTVTGDAFVFMFMGTDKGKALVERLKDAELAKSEKQSHHAKIYADKVGNNLFLEDEITMLKNRIKAGGAIWYKATAIHQKEDEFTAKIDEKKCLLQYHVYTDGNGKEQFKRTKRPFVIGEPGALGNVQRLPISSFIALDLDKAVANGGTYQAIRNTLNKGGQAPGENIPELKTIEQSFRLFQQLATFYSLDTESGKKKLAVLNAEFDKPQNEHWRDVFCRMSLAFDGIWTQHGEAWQKEQAKIRAETRALNAPKATAQAS